MDVFFFLVSSLFSLMKSKKQERREQERTWKKETVDLTFHCPSCSTSFPFFLLPAARDDRRKIEGRRKLEGDTLGPMSQQPLPFLFLSFVAAVVAHVGPRSTFNFPFSSISSVPQTLTPRKGKNEPVWATSSISDIFVGPKLGSFLFSRS